METIQNVPVQVVQGRRALIPVRLIDESTGDPYNLTGVEEIEACFMNTDGSELMLTLGSGVLVNGNPLLGKVNVSLTAAQTLLLRTVDATDLHLAITVPADVDPFDANVPLAYSVIENPC